MSLAAQRDIRHILHPWQHLSLEHCAEPLIIERAEGAYVFDSRGRRYLDAVGGLWCNAVGFGRGDMATAIHEQIKRLSFANSFVDMGNPRAAELAERLCEHAPQASTASFSRPAVRPQSKAPFGWRISTGVAAARRRSGTCWRCGAVITAAPTWRRH
jgi:adenosylmethionine-8-amino-7-oxononanoate aminotransferase